jgi:hypothetical protein
VEGARSDGLGFAMTPADPHIKIRAYRNLGKEKYPLCLAGPPFFNKEETRITASAEAVEKFLSERKYTKLPPLQRMAVA